MLGIYLNGGIMESWNHGTLGFLKDFVRYSFYRRAFGGPLTQHASIPKPILPIFQHSNIPIVSEAN
jgi:hypothetical protein